jgi:site-specific recombinase XerD
METKIKAFLETLDRSPRTISTYRNALRQFVKIVGDDAELNLETFIAFLVAIRPMSPASKQVYTTALKKFYRFYKICSSDELDEAIEHYTRRLGKRIQNVDTHLAEQVIQYCLSLSGDLEALRDRAFVLTLADTGLRISEACALKRSDIDWLERRSVIIGKGDKQAVVYYSERAINALKEYLHERSVVEPNSRLPLGSQPLFARHDIRASKKIRPITAGGMWKAIKKRIEEAGLNRLDVRIHDFRHYFVTMTYLAKGNMKLSQQLARHESIATTSRYTHFDSDIAKAYDEIFNQERSDA